MVELDALEQVIREALMLLPVALYLGICFAVAEPLRGALEWFKIMFDFEGLETVGDYLLQVGLIALHFFLTPGALAFYLLRGILRIKITHNREESENENRISRG